MSEEKEALQRLFDHNYGNDFYIKAEEDAEIIEQVLDDYDNLQKMKNELELTCKKQKEVLDIIIKKGIDILTLKECKKAKTYNEHTKRTYCEEYTENEFNKIKEAMKNG